MHCNDPIHYALADLLRFEEQRLGIPVEVWRKPLHSVRPGPFRPIIEIRIHTGTAPETFPVLLEDELLEVTAPIGHGQEDREVGFTDATGQFCPLAGITGNRVSLFFDLDEVFSFPMNVRRRPRNGPTPSGLPGNRLADLVFSPAFAVALGNIRRHDWRQEASEFAQQVLATRQQTADGWQQAFRENERSIEEKSFEIRHLAAKNAELSQRIRRHKLLTRKRVERRARADHANLVRLLGRSLVELSVVDGYLKVVTKPIEINWCGQSYEMGRFDIAIPMGTGRLRIDSHDGLGAQGYPHPHVASDGAPCLGNMASPVAQLLGEGEYSQLVTTLLEFLRSYNPDNPYIRLERWDPDWVDEDDRYDSCYDDSSLSDCATCSDWDCPHRDGAELRCYEHTRTVDCIACDGCCRGRDAMDHCRSQRQPWECVVCEAECHYAEDEEACFETHEGSACPDCPNTECSHAYSTDDEAAAA